MGAEFELLGRWISPYSPDGLIRELHKEVGPAHPLFSRPVKALAVARDCDEVIFEIEPGKGLHFAVVHLTWSGKTEPSSTYPQTQLFDSLADLVAWMKADHQDD